MEMETKTATEQSTTEHYILFRDDSDAASRIGTQRVTYSGAVVCYGECSDTAAYVWRSVGKMTDDQAEYARGRLRMEFKRKLREAELREVLDKEARREQQIDVLQGDRPFQDYRRKLVILLSMPTLMDLWQRPGGEGIHNPLKAAVGMWKNEVAESLVAPLPSPEKLLRDFKTILAKQQLTPFQQEVLDACAEIVKLVKTADGCEEENAVATVRPKSKPKDKPQKPKKPRKKRESKYEDAVQEYLLALREGVMRSAIPSSKVANLSSMVIAERLKDDERFSGAKLKSIEHHVRHSEAWKNRRETLKQVYDNKTFGERILKKQALPPEIKAVVRRSEKYEAPVEECLASLRNLALLENTAREVYNEIVNDLTATSLAEYLHENYDQFKKLKIDSIASGVRSSQAWLERRVETLALE